MVIEVIEMTDIIACCPACKHRLKITTLKCEKCGLELKNDFELDRFSTLDSEQYEFLISFLKNRGNMSALQNELKISYPYAQKKLSELLKSLKIESEEKNLAEENDMKNWNFNKNSSIPSEIIKAMLKENNGKAVVSSINGNLYEIKASNDGKSFLCDELPITPPYTYDVFDIIVNLLVSKGGKAKKGMGRNAKLGEPNCEIDTVVGTIGKKYFKKNIGDSVLDPVFVLASVLEWAGIATNRRGYIELTDSYRARINL